jgi:2-oxoisovalerate dehydrogenase E1 component
MGCGPVWEGICFAAMDQYKTLWDGDYKGGLPLIFNFMNNLYGMGGQTMGETMGYDILARVGAGVNPEMMHAERVDGYNPLAVIDAFSRKKQILKEKQGPVLLDTLTYRISGHSPSDASSYRSKEEIEAWQQEDSILSYGKKLVLAGIAKQDQLDDMGNDTKELLTQILKLSIDDEISPRINMQQDPDYIGKMMFSNGSVDKMEEGTPEVLLPLEENPRQGRETFLKS